MCAGEYHSKMYVVLAGQIPSSSAAARALADRVRHHIASQIFDSLVFESGNVVGVLHIAVEEYIPAWDRGKCLRPQPTNTISNCR